MSIKSRDYSMLRTMLKRHEGLRLKPYKDSIGKLTIGIGRNLDDNGITEWEAGQLLRNDLRRSISEAESIFPWFLYLDEVRQDVVLNMLFNLGMSRLLGFKNMLSAMKERNYQLAATEMINSLWAKQVGLRAEELAYMMLYGEYKHGLV